jgi:hypothetical protein
MDWKSWSFVEWNAALVDAVFLADGRAGTAISRVDANARFLAKCTDDPGCEPDEAKRCFVRSFGKSIEKIRNLYKWSSTIPLPRGQNVPRSFSALYLSLMAGSADDGTYELGQFRDRFIELLSPTVPDAETHLRLPFSDLPAMWRYVALWSELRQRELGDCGVLKLPEVPDSERLIGYSKRIAFPTYKDEVRLKQLLEDVRLSANSEFRQVVTALRSRLDQFSVGFVNEFESFTSFVAKHRLQEAYESRFWGLVRDMSLDEPGLGPGVRGKYCLELEASDPYEPVPYLFFDDAGLKRLPSTFGTLTVQRRDGLRNVAAVGTGYPPLDSLASAFQSPMVALSKVGRLFAAGWIPLLPDSLGTLSTDGEYSEGGQVCFLVRPTLAEQLAQQLIHLGIKHVRLGSNIAISGWAGFLCKTITRASLNRLLAIAPASVARLVRTGWSPPRVILAGGAWHGQALLLNPASNPVALMAGATGGNFRLIDASGNDVPGGGCLEVAEEGFRPSPFLLAAIPSEAHSCEYSLYGEGGIVKHLRVFLARTFPVCRPPQLRSPGSWQCDGSSGAMQPLASEGLEVTVPRPVGAGLPTVGFPPKVERSTQLGVEWSRVGVSAVPTALEWLSEALLLRFQSCSSLSFPQLMEHVGGAAFAVQISPKLLRRILVEGQWLIPVQRLGAPSMSITAAPRLAAVQQTGKEVSLRVTGMLGAADFAAIQACLLSSESATRLVAGPLSLGCLELVLESMERVPVFTGLLAARLIHQRDAPPPLAALAPASTHMVRIDPPSQGTTMQPWLPHVRVWGLDINPDQHWPIGEIRRLSGTLGQRTWYWLRVSDSHFARTDSLAWAWLAAEAAVGRPIAHLLRNGEIIWPRSIAGLPPALPRWWLLFGGGCISLSEDGQAVFTGPVSSGAARVMGLRTDALPVSTAVIDRAMEHRELALRLARTRTVGKKARTRVSDSGPAFAELTKERG